MPRCPAAPADFHETCDEIYDTVRLSALTPPGASEIERLIRRSLQSHKLRHRFISELVHMAEISTFAMMDQEEGALMVAGGYVASVSNIAQNQSQAHASINGRSMAAICVSR
jgi:hypothetical protein